MAALNLGFTCHFQVLWGGVGGDLDEILIFQGRNVGMEETRCTTDHSQHGND